MVGRMTTSDPTVLSLSSVAAVTARVITTEYWSHPHANSLGARVRAPLIGTCTESDVRVSMVLGEHRSFCKPSATGDVLLVSARSRQATSLRPRLAPSSMAAGDNQ
jgi:hypothetical protein